MKQHKLDKVTAGSHRFGNADGEDRDQESSREFEAAPDYYERRSRMRFKWQKGDSWISIGMYFVLVSVALVVL